MIVFGPVVGQRPQLPGIESEVPVAEEVVTKDQISMSGSPLYKMLTIVFPVAAEAPTFSIE